MRVLFRAVQTAFHDSRSRSHEITQAAVYALIVFSVGVFGLELYLEDADLSVPGWLEWVDLVVLALFALELVCRVGTYHPPELDFYRQTPTSRLRTHLWGRLRFCLEPMMLVDILTVAALLPLLRGLRALRLLRLVRTSKMFRYSNPLGALGQAFRDNGLVYSAAFSVLGVEVLLGGVTLFLVERKANPHIESVADGLWWSIVTLTTVGFGDITPVTGAGRIVGSFLMVGGMFTLAMFAGVVGNTLLSAIIRVREDQFRMGSTIDHVVVIGYSDGSHLLLDTLLPEIDTDKTSLLVFGEGERPPELPVEFQWISGDPAKESELDKARLADARAVVIAGFREVPPQQADAYTILVLFTIRRYMRRTNAEAKRTAPLYLVAEILEPENAEHARAAGADEVIETRRLGFSLVAHSVSEPGTGQIMSRVALRGDQNLYVGDLPSGIELPATFADIAAQTEGILPIGVRDPVGAQDYLNPGKGLLVKPGWKLIYLAEQERL